ncbi:MAG: type II secretion system minor pseudopilin GspH [Betaproteobacteria bacterium]
MGSLGVTRSNATRAGHAGFTLIEILVVIVVLGIAAAAVTIAYSGDDAGAASREARRFAGAIEHAAASAQVRAQTLGVSAEGTGWRFWQRDSQRGNWQPITDDDVLAPRGLPSSMRLAATRFAGAPVAADAILPLRPTGRNDPFAFTLTTSSTTLEVAADPLNRVAVARPTDAAVP